MRIIAGEFRRRKLLAPDGLVTRPIPDRVKESVFGMLGERVKGASMLDLFAGTGSIGLEAVSRGAKMAIFVERERRVAEILERNIATLGAGDRCKVVQGDALGQAVLARCPRPLDLAFLDPPYPLIREVAGWARVKAQAEALVPMLADDGFLILRTPWPFWLEAPPEGAAPVPESESAARSPRPRSRREDRDGPRPKRGRWQDVREERGARPPRKNSRGEDVIYEIGDDAAGFAGDLPADPEDFVDVDDPGVQVSEVAPSPAHLPVDLTLAGAAGPETHKYGSTAVHWYMRRKG